MDLEVDSANHQPHLLEHSHSASYKAEINQMNKLHMEIQPTPCKPTLFFFQFFLNFKLQVSNFHKIEHFTFFRLDNRKTIKEQNNWQDLSWISLAQT